LIAGVAIDTLVSNILPLAAGGHPLMPLITYADTRSTDAAADLRRALDEQVVHERTGCMLRTSYWPARLAWFRRTQPNLWRATAHWLTIGEYVERRLFGRCRVSVSVASWSGLLDRRQLAWDAPLLDILGVSPAQLSPLVDAAAPLRGLLPDFAKRWPALQDVPWFPAIGDGAAANIGSGCTNPVRVALTVGTTGAVRIVQTDVPRVPDGLWCYRVDRRHALLGGATSEGGNVYAWLRQTLNLGMPAVIEQVLASMEPDGHGLTVLPFLAGERSPGWAGDVRATIHGMSRATTPLEITRASLEAVTYRLALLAKRIVDQVDGTYQVIASGSALLQSPAWMQLIADVFGCAVVASAEPEATSRGAALLALQALGVLADIDAAPAADGQTYEPDRGRHQIYQAAIARQQRLYDCLIAAA